MKKIRYGSVCSGIEAATMAWQPLGWECAFVAEIEPFPCAVLKERHPHIPNYGDITKYREWPDETIDVLVGGTPCQSFSVAGLRAGLDDPRGNLALIFLGIVERYQPRWVLWENVPGVHSSWSDAQTGAADEESRERIEEALRMAREAGLDPGADFGIEGFEEADQTSDFDTFLSALEKLGYGIATTILDAQYFGVAQRRERVFVVGHIGGKWQRSAAVLFDAQSLSGNPPPSREKGQGVAHNVAPCIGASGRGFERTGDTRGQDCVIPIQEIGQRQSGTHMNGVGHGRNGDPMYTLQSGSKHGVAVTHSLRADGFDASEDGTGRGTPLVPEIACALQECDSKGSDSSTKGGHLIPFDTTQITSDKNYSNPKGGDPCHPLAAGAHAPAVAFERRMTRTTGGQPQEELNGCLRADENSGDGAPCVATPMAVRRLTPRECERLQGFPDDYTLIPYRNKTAADCPDGPRYKALGNSMAVPVIQWIGKQIQLVDQIGGQL